jgi:hypothetical protein
MPAETPKNMTVQDVILQLRILPAMKLYLDEESSPINHDTERFRTSF